MQTYFNVDTFKNETGHLFLHCDNYMLVHKAIPQKYKPFIKQLFQQSLKIACTPQCHRPNYQQRNTSKQGNDNSLQNRVNYNVSWANTSSVTNEDFVFHLKTMQYNIPGP